MLKLKYEKRVKLIILYYAERCKNKLFFYVNVFVNRYTVTYICLTLNFRLVSSPKVYTVYTEVDFVVPARSLVDRANRCISCLVVMAGAGGRIKNIPQYAGPGSTRLLFVCILQVSTRSGMYAANEA